MSKMVDRLLDEMWSRGLDADEDDARALLTSLRRATGRMLISARRYAGDNRLAEWDTSLGRHPNDMPFYEGLWQAMIDAALNE